MNLRTRIATAIAALCLLWSAGSFAQTTVSENFTGTTTTNAWYSFNGACLTAGGTQTGASFGTAGNVPGCNAMQSYYNENLVGGQNGTAGPNATLPDPVGEGALRFTNGCIPPSSSSTNCSDGGHSQNGVIVSGSAFPAGEGVQITFTTVTYRGDSGGNGSGCPSGTTYDSNTTPNLCVTSASPQGTSTTTYSCSSGYSLSGTTCTETATPTATSTTTYSCASGFTLSGTTCSESATGTTTYSCASGFTLSGTTCSEPATKEGNTYTCPNGTTKSGTGSGTTCSEAATATTSYSCPSGSTSSGSGSSMKCSEAATATTSYSCPTGTTSSGSGSSMKCSEAATATTTYSCPSGTTSSGSGSSTKCSEAAAATTTTTYSCPSGYSPTSGVTASTTCTRTQTASSTTTTTYACPSGYTPTGTVSSTTTCIDTADAIPDPHQNDGADGMSFFLMDASQPITFNSGTVGNFGSWGGSLGYSCSNSNPPYNGLVGAYIGLGIDEYGNFLNGTQNTLGITDAQSLGDNTASGGGQWANRIGLRGAGNVSWYWLNANYPAYYPSSLTSSQQEAAVQNTCETGTLWNYSLSTPTNTGVTAASTGTGATDATLYDYQALPGAYSVLTGVQIANEYATGGYARGNAVPITYKLQLTQNGLLSLWYSVDGGSWLPVLSGQSISASNPTMPTSFRFGFAGSTGGSSNIHEVLCFQAAPATQSSSSASANEKQSAQLQTGSQAYFAYYDPDDWTGRLTANNLSYNTSGDLVIASVANWDASCVLTGVSTGSTCLTTGAAGPSAEAPSSRTILTWNGSSGAPFDYTQLDSTEQADLAASASPYDSRVAYLRGDRSNEINSQGAGLYRARDSVLGDIVDSSPVWVGPPSASYPTTWTDDLYPSTSLPENSGQSYSAYGTAEETRQNVVYVGANDGLMHGFRSGAYSSSGAWLSTTNDGEEVIAYMPSAIVSDIHNATNPELDYSNPQYGHNFYADATPGTGDLFFEGAWHTWLVSGLGPGGADLFALDISNPGNFSQSNGGSLVIGDWTPSTLSCTNVGSCGSNLGNTYGSPIIRRMHNGDWAVIFGNGFGSATGDAGIYIMTVDQNTAATTFYYLSTGKAGTNDGIAYVTSADLDGDGIIDYVYAGDLLGNVWRFDVTSNNPAAWGASSAPLFTTNAGQPITTKLMVVGVANDVSAEQIMVAFGTGQKTPLTNSSPATYASGTQALYAFWDWNLSAWNAKSTVQYAALTQATSGLSAPFTLTPANLQAQSISIDSSGDRDITSTNICWQGTSTCSSGNDQFGWSVTLPGTDEQIIYNPEILSTAFLVNSIVPANNSPLSCTTNTDTGFTYAISMQTGGGINGFFVNNPNSNGNVGSTGSGTTTTATTAGIQTNATGTSFVIGSASGSGSSSSTSVSSSSSQSGSCSQQFLVYQTVSGTPSSTTVAPPCNATGKRLTWAQLR